MFSFFVVATSVALLFLINDKSWLTAAVAGVGIIVEGGGVKFVYDRRTEAKKEEEAAWRDYNKRCQDATSTKREV